MIPKSFPQVSSEPLSVRRLGLPDALCLTLTVLLCLFLTWFRRHGMFWNDEIMGWTVLRQPTWHRLYYVWGTGVDSSGFLFYVVARPWIALFGATELSLRMSSSFCAALAVVFAWLAARRFIRWQIVAIALPFVFLINRPFIQQLSNGRTYGVMLLGLGLTCYTFLRTAPDDESAGSPWLLLLTFLSLLILTGSHVLGMMFWGCFVLGMFARDLYLHRLQWPVYLAALPALLIVPFSWTNIQADRDMGKPTFWVTRPTFAQFPSGLDDFTTLTGVILLIALFVFLILRYRRPALDRGPLLLPSRVSFYALLGVLFFLPILMFTLSRIANSIFLDRYLLPVCFGDAFLLCELLTRTWDAVRLPPPARLAGAALALLALATLFGFDLVRKGLPQPDYTQSLLAKLPSNEPIVFVAVPQFIEMAYYHNNDRRFLTPIDWSIQLDPHWGVGGASLTHEMLDWKKSGIYAAQIQPTAQILQQNPNFTMVCDRYHTLWCTRYILDNPAYRATELPSWNDYLLIWSVHRR